MNSVSWISVSTMPGSCTRKVFIFIYLFFVSSNFFCFSWPFLHVLFLVVLVHGKINSTHRSLFSRSYFQKRFLQQQKNNNGTHAHILFFFLSLYLSLISKKSGWDPKEFFYSHSCKKKPRGGFVLLYATHPVGFSPLLQKINVSLCMYTSIYIVGFWLFLIFCKKMITLRRPTKVKKLIFSSPKKKKSPSWGTLSSSVFISFFCSG